MLMYKSKLTMGEEGGFCCWMDLCFVGGTTRAEIKMLWCGTNLQMRDVRDGGNSDETLLQ